VTTYRVAYETARLRLSRYRLEGEQGRLRAAAHATRVSSEALDVSSASVWIFRDGGELTCINRHDRMPFGEHANVVRTPAFPGYMASLSKRRVLAAQDARAHEATRELADSYLVPRGIGALLDTPMIRGGRVFGIVRHEHVGGPRAWTQRDVDFASSVGDLLTLAFEQADRLTLEAALQEQAEQRQESQKMEALGRMACAIAHDVNNLLSAASMSTEAMMLTFEPAHMPEFAREMQELFATGQRLTARLLEFGRERAVGDDRSSDLVLVLGRMLPMLRTAVGRRIALSSEIRCSSAIVPVDPSHAEQVLLNLLLNARDAIGESGSISIVLRNSTLEDDAPPDSVVVSVFDDGKGMDEATRMRVFEPFFTTKSQGTGLGLATVFGIVRRAEGVIRVTSEPGVGTAMHVILPRAETG
jgi:signal transduction histidine kinase